MDKTLEEDMNILKYYVSLRADILRVITGVENAGWSLFWDDTSANRVTKRKLEDIYSRYLNAARGFGLFVVTRHCNCSNRRHEGYPVSNEYGLPIKYQDPDYVWRGGQMFQGNRCCVCPCSIKNGVSEHHVIDDVIYDKNADQVVCGRLESILYDLVHAIGCSGDKMPRSAIRENLLRAVLKINDQILPEPMDTYIEKIMR